MKHLKTISRRLWLTALTLALVPSVWAATTVIVGTDASKTVITGTLVTPDQIFEGQLVAAGFGGCGIKWRWCGENEPCRLLQMAAWAVRVSRRHSPA